MAGCLDNQALILKRRGDLDGAIRLHKEEEQLCRELGNMDGLAKCLGNQAGNLCARGDLDGAMRLLKEREGICRELGNMDGLATCLVDQADLIAHSLGRPREALPLAEEGYRVATTAGLVALARQIQPVLEGIQSQIK